MKLPKYMPNILKLLSESIKMPEKFKKIYEVGLTDADGRYLHWEKVRFIKPPPDLTHEEHWLGMKLARGPALKPLPFHSKEDHPFKFAAPDAVMKMLHQIDKSASGNIRVPEPVTNPHTRDAYVVNSLIEEAINSSQLEGASTTRKVAKEMLRTNRQPRNRSEQMIFNNYVAMSFVRDNYKETLTPEIILELHAIVTDKTLDEPDYAGKFRRDSDNIVVYDPRHEHILHEPPKASELPERLKKLCDFANDVHGENESNVFIHPVIRAIILHFMLAYDHPFVDGNGRTARALFYWLMAKEGYWLVEFLTISKIIRAAPAKYAYAFIHTETDDNDTTYFIIHQLKVILRAIDELHSYLANRVKETRETITLIRQSSLEGKLNHRQIEILKDALDDPTSSFTISAHQDSHRISYQTARTDLLNLSDKLLLLIKYKEGKTFRFIAPPDLKERFSRL